MSNSNGSVPNWQQILNEMEETKQGQPAEPKTESEPKPEAPSPVQGPIAAIIDEPPLEIDIPEQPAVFKPVKPKRKGNSKLLISVLILIILTAGAASLHFFGIIDIPFLPEHL